MFDFYVVFVDTMNIEACGLQQFKNSLMHARRATIHTIGTVATQLPLMHVSSAQSQQSGWPLSKWNITFYLVYLV